jgi:hypothetical protein
MELRDLRYLAASASAGNFGRAAKSLGFHTSTISRRIGRLEDELGLTLFERGHVRLTAAGRAVMLHVTMLLKPSRARRQKRKACWPVKGRWLALAQACKDSLIGETRSKPDPAYFGARGQRAA